MAIADSAKPLVTLHHVQAHVHTTTVEFEEYTDSETYREPRDVEWRRFQTGAHESDTLHTRTVTRLRPTLRTSLKSVEIESLCYSSGGVPVLSYNLLPMPATPGQPPFRLGATLVTTQMFNILTGKTEEGSSIAPMVNLLYPDIIKFCNTLSELLGLTRVYQQKYTPQGWTMGATWNRSASGLRLPTEDEWELASRAGDTGLIHPFIDEMSWHERNCRALQPVAQKAPNALGLYDTLGNAWDRCHLESTLDASSFAGRGGGWQSAPTTLTYQLRETNMKALRYGVFGFRLARTV